MLETTPGLIEQVRDRFAHVDSCPFSGERVFFENAGGALTLKSVVETSARFAAIPDNPGRINPAGQGLVDIIDRARADMRVFFNAPGGQFFVGESGTELLFRLIRAAVMGSAPGGRVLGSTLEHPATRSAAARWSAVAGKPHVLVAHDSATGSVDPAHYRPRITADTRVATILHTSPVTGMGVDIAAIAGEIRAVAPDCLIVVDGIQHAAHGGLDIAAAGIDGYVVSPYKVFSRHGYGVAWISDRLAALPHDALIGGPADAWELGTRDAGSYATFSDVVAYFEWLGAQVADQRSDAAADPADAVSGAPDRRARILAAGAAIRAQESRLCAAMLHGTGNLRGLAEMPKVSIIGGVDNPRREGLVSLTVEGVDSADVVARLNAEGIRTHLRKADHYSGNILEPLGLGSCVRVSMCHYNTEAEVARFLTAMQAIAA